MKVLLVGPLSPPIHGQSLAFTRFVENINNNKTVINTNLGHQSALSKIINYLKNLILIFIKTLFFKYDVVYFTCSRSLFGSLKDVVLINVAKFRKIKVINHLHGSDFNKFLHNSPKAYKKILIYTYNKVDISIVLLDKMQEQFKDFPDMHLHTVVNFYDDELDATLVNKERNGNINLLYLSNIMSSKGIFELLDAFIILSKQYNNIYLNIAGDFIADDDMNLTELKQQFYDKLKQNNRIKYFGTVFGDKKVKLLKSSDIFILPSYYKSEAFPISIIEAMACGNAIIATNYKYLPQVVSENNGLLVEPKSITDLVRGVQSLLNDKNKLKEMQDSNKQEAREKYSLNNYLASLNQIVLGRDGH